MTIEGYPKVYRIFAVLEKTKHALTFFSTLYSHGNICIKKNLYLFSLNILLYNILWILLLYRLLELVAIISR